MATIVDLFPVNPDLNSQCRTVAEPVVETEHRTIQIDDRADQNRLEFNQLPH